MESNLPRLKSCGYASTTMPKEIKDKWLKALRSGEYKQDIGRLYNAKTGGYCCLGVLEHVLIGTVEVDNQNHSFSFPSTNFLDKWDIKFNDIINITVPYGNGVTTISMLNDMGIDFNQIADILDEHIETI